MYHMYLSVRHGKKREKERFSPSLHYLIAIEVIYCSEIFTKKAHLNGKMPHNRNYCIRSIMYSE